MIVEDDGMERRGRLLAGRLLGDLQVWGGKWEKRPESLGRRGRTSKTHLYCIKPSYPESQSYRSSRRGMRKPAMAVVEGVAVGVVYEAPGHVSGGITGSQCRTEASQGREAEKNAKRPCE